MKRKIILDCDPGKDDAFAILYALKSEVLDVQMITTVSGNVDVNKTTHNACGLVGFAKSNVPVYKGSTKPLYAKPLYADNIHGINGLGGVTFKQDCYIDYKDNAVEAMIQLLETSSKKISIAATGPLTNIAKLLLMRPDLKAKIEVISLMGGGIKGGNTTKAAEFNMLADPEAAWIVFNSGVPLIVAPLDVTETASIKEYELKEIESLTGVGDILSRIIMNNRFAMKDTEIITNLHDVVAVMALESLDMFEHIETNIDIECVGQITRGYTLVDLRISDDARVGNATVLTALNHHEFMEHLIERLRSYA